RGPQSRDHTPESARDRTNARGESECMGVVESNRHPAIGPVRCFEVEPQLHRALSLDQLWTTLHFLRLERQVPCFADLVLSHARRPFSRAKAPQVVLDGNSAELRGTFRDAGLENVRLAGPSGD